MRYDSNFVKPLSFYYNETVQCEGKKGDSVKIEKKSCVRHLTVSEMKVYRTNLLAGRLYYRYLSL